MAARGATVCRVHGGSAPQVKAAAQRRLQQTSEALTERLLGFALDGEVPDAVALTAVRDALDRAGITAKQAFELSAEREPAPWEQMFSGIAKITRAEHEAKMAALRNGDARAARELNVVEAEVVPPRETHDYRPSGSIEAAGQPGGANALGNESATSRAPGMPPPRALNQDEAADVMRESRRRTGQVGRRRRARR